MTINERKMAIAYANLLNIQELVQHICRMESYQLFSDKARKAFAAVGMNMDIILADVNRYMYEHTDFESDKDK